MPQFALIVLLGPVAALYDLATNPNGPPLIFAAQFVESFGHAPGANLPPPVKPVPHRRVTVTRPA